MSFYRPQLLPIWTQYSLQRQEEPLRSPIVPSPSTAKRSWLAGRCSPLKVCANKRLAGGILGPWLIRDQRPVRTLYRAKSKWLDRPVGYKGFLADLLKAGYAVVATDYEGLGTPGEHRYIIADSEARGMIDTVRGRTGRSSLVKELIQ